MAGVQAATTFRDKIKPQERGWVLRPAGLPLAELHEWLSGADALAGDMRERQQHPEAGVKWLTPEACMRVLQVGGQLFWHQMHAVAFRMAACCCMPVRREHATFGGGRRHSPPAGGLLGLQTAGGNSERWLKCSCRLMRSASGPFSGATLNPRSRCGQSCNCHVAQCCILDAPCACKLVTLPAVIPPLPFTMGVNVFLQMTGICWRALLLTPGLPVLRGACPHCLSSKRQPQQGPSNESPNHRKLLVSTWIGRDVMNSGAAVRACSRGSAATAWRRCNQGCLFTGAAPG